jgi:hypothetical protein
MLRRQRDCQFGRVSSASLQQELEIPAGYLLALLQKSAYNPEAEGCCEADIPAYQGAL